MHDGTQSLTDREKETLRLLLVGHDAKSIARALGLSVHTVNERLRDARRKLGVSSSREAARLLARADANTPNFLVDKPLGVAGGSVGAEGQLRQRRGVGLFLAWLGGGALVMSIVIAGFVLLSTLHAGHETQTPVAPDQDASMPSANEADALGAGAGRQWAQLLDGQRWDEAWGAAGTIFKAQSSQAGWPSIIQPVRQPLGPVTSRVFHGVKKAGSLPGAPSGDYEIIEFATNFANKPGAIETVVLAREGSAWKVNGYFIR